MARTRYLNAGVDGYGSGQPGGQGDRGATHTLSLSSNNPYYFNDFVSRWRLYVGMFQTSWEARKIIKIVVEDALRKEWIAENIPEEMTKRIWIRLKQLNFTNALKRSLMLERLMGGCLTFMGIEDNQDNPDSRYNPRAGNKLCFTNPIPISRIARLSWDHDPLSAGYMRPNSYLINQQEVDVSRLLVWNGDPLFDPYDYTLQNFRSNLAGFGPSKLAPIWDDIIKAIGTRQAAYQLIQTNNAIIMAVNNLQDLQGTTSGKQALEKVKSIANQISMWRAAVVDGENVQVKTKPASFGSVPELLMTFIQILSAASDIPATRFIGQAPGGLNATGESDLENYYNMIDSYQHQKIEPGLRKIYDVIGYHEFGAEWKKERENLDFNFPPLWNPSELEEAQTHTLNIDNALKLYEMNMISDAKVVEEINAKKALSVELEESDIQTIDDSGLGIPNGVNAQDEFKKLALGKEVSTQPGDKPSAPTIPIPQKQQITQPLTPKVTVPLKNKYWTGIDFENSQKEKFELDGLAKDFWRKLIQDSMDKFGISFDLENDDSVQNIQTYTVSSDEPIVRVKYQLCQAGGDWQNPVNYFRCQLVKGYFSGLSFYGKNNGCFIFIPSFTEGNENLVKGKGKIKWIAGHSDESEFKKTNHSVLVKSWKVYLDDLLQEKRKVENKIPLDKLPEPTEKQKESGNYKKHHIKVQGLDISVENPQGSVRKSKDSDNEPWEVKMPAHYGYVKKTEGKDGDQVDVYIGPEEDSELVFVVDQQNPDTQEFDEHKCILGTLSMVQAKDLYVKSFSDNKGKDRIQAITPVYMDVFKEWLKTGATTVPYSNTISLKVKGGRTKRK